MAFVKVANLGQITLGAFISVTYDGEAIALYNVGGTIYATRDECSHDGGTLTGGTVEGTVVVCPRHGAKFDVSNGAVLAMPAFEGIETFAVKVTGDDIYVDIDE